MSLEPGKWEEGNSLSWASRRCLVLDLVGKKGRSKPGNWTPLPRNLKSPIKCRKCPVLRMPRSLLSLDPRRRRETGEDRKGKKEGASKMNG